MGMFLYNGDQLYSAWGCSYAMGISCTVHGDVLIQWGSVVQCMGMFSYNGDLIWGQTITRRSFTSQAAMLMQLALLLHTVELRVEVTNKR